MPVHVAFILVDVYFQGETNLKGKKRVRESYVTAKTSIARFCFVGYCFLSLLANLSMPVIRHSKGSLVITFWKP
jgi:hypothetical protein